MTPRTCPRCRATLHSEDANSLVFCWSCGAPQVYLSEELQEQFAQQQLAPQPGDAAAPPIEPVTDPTAVVWSRAIQLAGLAGAAVVALLLVAGVVRSLALLVLFWAMAAPIILMGIYCARTPRTRITAGFGAQLGLLTGLSIAICSCVMNVAGLLLTRFALHQGPDLDAGLNTFFATLHSQMLAQPSAQSDPAAVQAFFQWFNIPEFRVGMVLTGGLIFFGFYLLYATLAGAFAGLLRSRAKAV